MMMITYSGICISKSLKIPREVRPDTFSKILVELSETSKAKVVVMFVNEDNCRRLVNASIHQRLTDAFYWLASDSWGAKMFPVMDQEWAAQGTVTILPQREVIQGKSLFCTRVGRLDEKKFARYSPDVGNSLTSFGRLQRFQSVSSDVWPLKF